MSTLQSDPIDSVIDRVRANMKPAQPQGDGIDDAINRVRQQMGHAPGTGYTQELGRGLVRGYGGGFVAGGGLAKMAGTGLERLTDAVMPGEGGKSIVSEGLKQYGEFSTQVGQGIRQQFPSNPNATTPQKIVGAVGEGVPNLVPQVGIATLTGGGSLPIQLGIFAGTAAAPVIGQQYNDALAHYANHGIQGKEAENRAVLEAGTAGLITAATSYIPGMALLRKVPGGEQALRAAASGIISRVATAGAAESVQEMSERLATDYVVSLIRQDPVKYNMEYFKSVGMEGIAAFVLGGAVRGGVEVLARQEAALETQSQPQPQSTNHVPPDLSSKSVDQPLQTPYVSKFTQPVRDVMGENLARQRVEAPDETTPVAKPPTQPLASPSPEIAPRPNTASEQTPDLVSNFSSIHQTSPDSTQSLEQNPPEPDLPLDAWNGREINAALRRRSIEPLGNISRQREQLRAAMKPSPSTPAPSRTEIQPGPDSGAAPRKVVAPSVESTKGPEKKEGGDTAQGVFTTAKGSAYEILADGTTRRNKAARAEHPGDSGLKDKSESTIFVGLDDSDEISHYSNLDASRNKKMEFVGDKVIIEYDQGKKRVRKEIAFTHSPKVGMAPVELWKNAIHVGNEIVNIKPAARKSTPLSTTTQSTEQVAVETSKKDKESSGRLVLWGRKPSISDGQWIKLNDRGHVVSAREQARRDGWEVTARKPGEHPDESGSKPDQTGTSAPISESETRSGLESAPAKGTQIPKMSDSELRWTVKNDPSNARRNLARTMLVKKDEAAWVLQRVENAARERIKTRKRPAARTKGKLRGGSAPLFQDIADLSIIAAARAAKLGVRGYKKVRSLVEQIVNETAPHLKSSIGRIAAQANKLRLVSKGDPEKFEQAATQLRKRAEIHDRRTHGTTIKAQIAEQTGPRREKLTVKETDALKARIKGEQFAAKIGYKASTETSRLVSQVKKIKPKKIRKSFIESVEGLPDTFFKDKTVPARIKDIALFMDKYPGQGLTDDMRTLVGKLDKAKMKNLTPDEANDLRSMVRTFLKLHSQHGKLLADEKMQRFKQAVTQAIVDVKKAAPELDTSTQTPKHRGTLKDKMLDWQDTPDVRAMALGGRDSVAHRVFYDNLRKGQTKAFELERKARDEVADELQKQKIDDAKLWQMRARPTPIRFGGQLYGMTRGERMAFYALWQRVEARGKIVRNGFKAQRFKGLLKRERLILGDESQMHGYADQIISTLTVGERAVVDRAIQAVATHLKPPANETSEQLTGNPIFTEADYTLPIRTERLDQQRNLEPDIKSFESRWIENAGFTKETVKHKHPVLVGDFFTEMYGHMQNMATYARLAAPIRDALKFLGHPEYGNALRERFGTKFEERTITTMAKLSGMFQQPRTDLEKAAAAITRNLAVGKLGFRLTTYLANRLGGLSLGSSYLNTKEAAMLPVYATRASAGLDLGGFTKAEQDVLDKLESNGYLYHRWNVDTYRLGVPGFDETDSRIPQYAILDKLRQFQNFATSHMRYAERRNAVAFFRAMTVTGASETDAITRVEQLTRETQNPVTPLEESAFVENVKRNPFAAMAWMFTSQINITRNMLRRAAMDASQTQTNAARFHLAMTTTAVALNIALMLVVRELWRRTKEGFDEDDERKKRTAADHATSAGAEAVDLMFPGAGDLVNAVVRKLRGKPVYSRTPYIDFFDSMTALPADIAKLADKDTKPANREAAGDRTRDAIGNIGAMGLGIPSIWTEFWEAIDNLDESEEVSKAKPKKPQRPQLPKLPRPPRPRPNNRPN